MFKKRKKKAFASTIENEINSNNKELLELMETDVIGSENVLADESQLVSTNDFQKTLLEYELENYEQVVALADRLIAGENLIVNVSNLEKIERKRVLEFLGGVLYVLQGKAKKITDFGYVFITNYEK